MTRLKSFGSAAALSVFLLAESGAALAQTAPSPNTEAPAETTAPPAVQPLSPPSTIPEAPAATPAPGSSTSAPPASGATAVEPASPSGAAGVAPAGTEARPSADTGSPATPEETPAASSPTSPALPAETTVGTPQPSTPPAPASFAGPLPPELSGSSMPHDLSPWGMFMAADWVVKAVMIGLVFASLVTWTIWLAKALELGFAKRRAGAQVRRLESASSLDAALSGGRRPLGRGPVAALAQTAAAERELSGDLSAEGVKERVAVALQRIEARSGRRMARGTGLLATIGSTAPFVGLFGTVWGIMNSFIGIAEANTTNLAVVAPGIAEALLATAIGLVAAIPAVIIYNVFARSIAGYRSILSDGSAAVLRHLSRDLDRRDHGLVPAVTRPYAAAAE